MDRRLIGALLLVAVLAAGAVAAKSSGLRTVGTASIGQLPADPRVGDCLLEAADRSLPEFAPPPRASSRPLTTAAPTALPEIGQDVVGPLFGPCTGAGNVGGEVVALLSATGDAWARHQRAQSNGVDCRAASLQYAGLRAVENHFELAQQSADDPVVWRMSINLKSGWVLPSSLLQSAGRTWLACVAAPSDGALYTGRLAGAYQGAQLPDAFGTCWNSRGVSAGVKTLDCHAPHLAELVSYGLVPDRSVVTYPQIRSSCEQLTARVLRRNDPTAGGLLAVKTSPDRVIPTGNDSLSVLCYVTPTGDRELGGTLVALGDKPIPFVG
jgi:hypothetical protein